MHSTLRQAAEMPATPVNLIKLAATIPKGKVWRIQGSGELAVKTWQLGAPSS
jgi:hypothetical protein